MYKKLMLLFTACFFAAIAFAQKPVIFQRDGKALSGYDVVSFYSETGPLMGHDSLSVQWQGASWLFASAASKEAFTANPEKFAPQFGGYCAYGMAGGYKASTTIDTWTIENGRLYFNYNKKVKTFWDKDRAGYIEKANSNWPAIKLN